MTQAPRFPKEQPSFADKAALAAADSEKTDRRDLDAEIQTGQLEANPNSNTPGCFGGLKQSLNNHWKVQDR